MTKEEIIKDFDKLFPFSDLGSECCIEPTERHSTTLKQFLSQTIDSLLDELEGELREDDCGENENSPVGTCTSACGYNAREKELRKKLTLIKGE